MGLIISHLKQLPTLLEETTDQLTDSTKTTFMHLYEHFKNLSHEIGIYDRKINQHAQSDVLCQEITAIEGIGPMTASAIIATIGDPRVFKNGREVSAWLGLVPKQHSSGNKIRLSGISKRGDRYVRKLLIHGARTVVRYCEKKTDKKSVWLASKKRGSGYNKAAVALANKNARIIWAMMASGECYRPNYKLLKAA